MNKELFDKTKLILDEIKAKYTNRIRKPGETLTDPVLSPYPIYTFLADRDPTEDEPNVYHGYDGLVLFWVNQTSTELSVSTDNLDPTLGWKKVVTA